MSLARPEADGPLLRERLRTARLYFVCDALPGGREPEALLRAALGGGVDIVQLREKELDRGTVERSARTFRRLCDTYSALFIVNDDPYLARSCDADGVHVGQDDVAADEARAILGPDAILGLSTHSEEQIAASAGAPVDYISVGPVWETPTKAGRPGVGLGLVSHAAANAPHPFFAIGGIDPSNAAQVVEAGARRLGVVRAIRDGEDPAGAAR
ncbi:MAG TPA: thiamine phosphate synthase [Solirubrobacterales bacterium]